MSSYIDLKGYRVYDAKPEQTITAKFKGFCSKCRHTFWAGETVQKAKPKGFSHLDCLLALADRTPRSIDPKFERELKLSGLGIPDKAILKKKAKKRILKNS